MSPMLCAGLVRPAQLECLCALATVPDPEPRVDCGLGEIERLARGAALEHRILCAHWEQIA